jgi:4-amino-4-deoxy-L-arabinose transferase-like glycosyltransferase
LRAEQLALDGAAPARAEALHVRDLLWVTVGLLLLIASGFGLRDPWPADEPRFALVARDMVASGNWLFPRVGGDLYPDKPPVFFWLLAGAWALTGSMRWSFLLPSLLAACGITFLVYDIARRLGGREAAFCAAGLLLSTIQFVVAMRSAQIDATLCFLTTAALYGFLRHLLLGPAWGWYFVGGLASGLGVATKGVGFLPLLVFVPYALLRARGFSGLARLKGGARWGFAPAGFLLGVGLWLVPMLVAVTWSGDPALAEYRDAILFRQTVERYASAWHHVKPWHYFLIEVVPPLWLPLSALLFWLVPSWTKALRGRDARVWLPLGWALLTLVFFSLSSGKRGIYILPALPAVVLAAAPYLPDLFRRAAVRRLSLGLGAVLVIAGVALATGHALGIGAIVNALELVGLSSVVPITVFAAAGGACWLFAWRRSPMLAWPAVFASFVLVWGYLVSPEIDHQRSGRAFVESALRKVPPEAQLGIVEYKEQFLLYIDRPSVNFGHARWAEHRSHEPETYDAARWLNGAPHRVLLLPEPLVSGCFGNSPRMIVGETSRETWALVRAPADETCARRGDPGRVIHYSVPARAAVRPR